MRETRENPLRLTTVSGPERVSCELAPEQVHRLGRSLSSDICLLHENVSRRHASLAQHNGAWFVTDLESRHGTGLNGVRLTPRKPGRIEDGDFLQVGPWVFRLGIGAETTATVATIDDNVHPFQIQQLDDRDFGAVAQHRLTLLIDCAAEINAVTDQERLTDIVLRSAMAGTGFPRAAWIEPVGSDERVELVASHSADHTQHEEFPFSRSVIAKAASGQMVRLSAAEVPTSHSIAELGIHSALCAPILLDNAPTAYLYLDARGREAEVRADAAEYCQALARICGLAMASLMRSELESRQRVLEAELTAAHEAQRLILPPSQGTVNGLHYAQRIEPGMIVAGDLFDVVPLEDGRAAIIIGDVTGEGIGAALLMASAQAQLHAVIAHGGDPVAAVRRANGYVEKHSADDRFVSMWVGLFDPSTRTLTYIDAGHGHWTVIPDAQAQSPHDRGGRGIPLGIEPSFPYTSCDMTLDPNQRLVLLSDGILEQRSPDGVMFGWDRVREAIRDSLSADDDVDLIFGALREFAHTDSLDDDATVASVGWA